MDTLVQQYLQDGDIPAAVCAYVKQRDYVTFAELERDFAEAAPVKGSVALCLPQYENIVLWAGMSQEWANLLVDLFQTHRLYTYPASPLVYLVDGKMLQLPLAKRAHQYKTEHWAPVTMRCVPPPRKTGALEAKQGERAAHARARRTHR